VNSNLTSGTGTADMFILQTGTTITSQRVLIGNSVCATGGTMSGTVNGSNVNLTLTENDTPADTVNVTGTLSNSVLSGNYTTAGACTSGDKGTFSATLIPSIASNSWSGSTTSTSGGGTTSFTAQLQEDKSGNLTGTATFNSSVCLTTATLTGLQVGDQAGIDDNAGNFSAVGTINSTGKGISGTYTTGSACGFDSGTFSMSRP
jgi:hypothetical protein